ncbi:hypothetical protein [Sphingomonas abietis]|uniref:Gluconate 2-dehydrogenase subunit 3 family protein n=1 Tax=Sphingomonas abietis TaxID=3012344 RepID=A0ABY7NKC1_9SPHN|nr:hypothetical protein [Sphingomonas abietis]WBO21969.1 hypothetical protein PBT88_17675 [Sphingomonas abietis]
MSALSSDDRETFARIADYLIPEGEGMPAATQVEVQNALLDKVLAVRPDLTEALVRGLRAVSGLAGDAAANRLNDDDAEAFNAVALAASGGYYMSPIVREAIGYPGQTSRPFDPDKTTDYLDDGLLAPVIARGSIYQPAP